MSPSCVLVWSQEYIIYITDIWYDMIFFRNFKNCKILIFFLKISIIFKDFNNFKRFLNFKSFKIIGKFQNFKEFFILLFFQKMSLIFYISSTVMAPSPTVRRAWATWSWCWSLPVSRWPWSSPWCSWYVLSRWSSGGQWSRASCMATRTHHSEYLGIISWYFQIKKG